MRGLLGSCSSADDHNIRRYYIGAAATGDSGLNAILCPDIGNIGPSYRAKPAGMTTAGLRSQN